jgi:ring-1,2-phenylacetyl-CoA epoxidase subunit PaaD
VSPLEADRLARARACAAAVPDPEIPVVTLEDLGILRDVRDEGGRVVVELTPTYTGCPATQVIADDVRRALADAGVVDAEVRTVLSPPWTTDWISAQGRRKLREYGIAPPGGGAPVGSAAVLRFAPREPSRRAGRHAAAANGAPALASPGAVSPATEAIACPRCRSVEVERLSEYGSTPCKALWRCLACREPFDYFKPY